MGASNVVKMPDKDHMSSIDHMTTCDRYSAHNYSPLPVVIARGEGVWAYDVEGVRYLDMLSAYSALNFGHRHPRLVARAHEQLDKLTLTSRAFHHDQFAPFCKELAELCGKEAVLPMNSGAEAVESALKISRKWGYERKGVPPDHAEVICFEGNFHGRTTTIVSFSDADSARGGFGPFTPGFRLVPFGDVSALERAITDRTVAVLLEPLQGEGGVIVPPAGFIRKCRELCTKHKVLLLADEIQTGLCRTGKLFACDHEGVVPDAYILGKSLGGGLYPVSAVVANRDVMDVLTPGTHGSTFGGNTLACAIGREVVKLIREEQPEKRAAQLGADFAARLRAIRSDARGDVRALGLLCGVDVEPRFGTAKDFCKQLLKRGLLCKDTRSQTIRFAPPLTIDAETLTWAADQVRDVFESAKPR